MIVLACSGTMPVRAQADDTAAAWREAVADKQADAFPVLNSEFTSLFSD
jgi:hypothetical protein